MKTTIRAWFEAASKQYGEVVASTITDPAVLDKLFYSGFGSAGCDPFYAWTPTHVLFVHEYDGSTSLQAIPRNPSSDLIPEFCGDYVEDGRD